MTRRHRLLLATLAVVAVWVVTGIVLFVWPHDDTPGRAEAVVVLAGASSRLPRGLELVREGVAPVLVLSRDGRLRIERACAQPMVPTVCFTADPDNTRGEARAVARLARARGWEELVVVTSRFHVFRARLLFDRCVDGDVRMTGTSVDWWRWPESLFWETVKLLYATIDRDC